MIEIALVEDEISFSETLKEYLQNFFSIYKLDISIHYYSNATSFLSEKKKFDFIFMDIDLKDKINGMELTKIIREKDKDVIVFFVTNLAQYAINGYEVEAFDFILKPINYNNFAIKLDRAFKCYQNKKGIVIVVPSRNGKENVLSEELKYVEIMEHKLLFHTINGIVTGTGTMKSVLQKLEGLPFYLCNQCYLVNLKYVTGIYDNQVKIGKELLQMSAPKKKDFMTALNNYLGYGNKLR